MCSLPFQLLVLSDLDLQDVARSDRPNRHPLGVIEEPEHQPLWKSKPNTTYPQELGLILLSAQSATIKTMRLTVEPNLAPAQLMFIVFCSESVKWDICSPPSVDTFRDSNSKVVRLDASECPFLKLVVHGPYHQSSQQIVVLEDIELLGSIEDSATAHGLGSSLSCAKFKQVDEFSNHRSGVIHRRVRLPLTSDNDNLQAILLDAGVPMDLVVQVATISEHEESGSLPKSQSDREECYTTEFTPESNSQVNGIIEISDRTSLQYQKRIDNEDKEPISPFDGVLRQHIKQTSRERHMLEEIFANKIYTRRDEIDSWQSPTITPDDPVNSNEITLYTFGTFFTQCLLCGDAEIQVTCVQLVERVAPLLKNAIGSISTFEGIIALIILGVREAKSSQTFHAAIHLAYTVFHTESMHVQNSSHTLNAKDDNFRTSALGLIEEVACANWSYGLRITMERILASSLCWSVGHIGTSMPCKTSFRVSNRSPKPSPSIDRQFLQFIRLLVEQDLTRENFFNELIDLASTDNEPGSSFTRNRLRLFRLILRNELIRCKVPPYLKMSVQTLCSNVLTSLSSPRRGLERDTTTTRLASECLTEIDRPGANDQENTKLLTSLHRHLEDSNIPNSHHYIHTALYIQDPLLDADETEFMTQLQRYFSGQTRPNALYRHSFVRTSAVMEGGPVKTCESLRKGNIVFQGQLVARTPPTGTFHDEIERNSAPFVFDLYDMSATGSSLLSADHQKVTSSFAIFRGTLERRSATPKRSSRVSPAQQKAALMTGTKMTNTQHDVDPGNKTLITSLSGNLSPDLDAKILPNIPAPRLTPVTAATIAGEQTPKQPEDIKYLNTSNDPDRKSGNKYNQQNRKNKGNVKDKNKKDYKNPDNCILQ
ncbi:hypothetical protein PHMEG_00015027 [Phytophthora megakarya]|uniref:Uncharacterized protein n=1 Tax=Phytophthora megakarya TaxID=4795 RepID=A0A225W4E3_9STRA|nr:hypothetical protein PHMEG_00015027 [Phytophthora megakarya]